VTTLRAGTATDVGQVRQVNQDRVLATEVLWLVADGMGGHQAGEVAAEVAVATIQSYLAEHGPAALAEAVVDANSAVIDQASTGPDMAGMGTTVTAMTLVAGASPDGSDDVLVLANVGDSRTYLLPAGTSRLVQISEDHSLVATLERQGQLTAAEAAVHPQRNIITRALGVDPVVLVDTWDLLPVAGDRYVMCSDGLTNEVSDDVMASVLVQFDDPAAAAAELVRLANEGGGRDNITVAVLDVVTAATSTPSGAGIAADGSSRVLAMTGGVADEPLMSVDGAAPAQVPGAQVPGARASGGQAPGGQTPGEQAPGGQAPREQARRGRARSQPSAREPSARRSAGQESSRRSRFTWRVGVFVLALVVLAGATVAVVAFAARNTYFVGTDPDGTTVVVFRGQPGGLLWFDPKVVAETDLSVDDLPVVARRSVADGHQEPSLADALTYVENLRAQVTTTTTTTTSTTTTSTTAPTAATLIPATASTLPSVPAPVPGG